MITVASKGLPGHSPGWHSKVWVLPGLIALAVCLALARHLPERLYFGLVSAASTAPANTQSLRLSEYRVQVEARPVAGVVKNLSGLSYDDEHRQLWAVINNPPELVAMNTQGELLARYPLNGFQDVEGVAYLGDDLLVLSDERRQQLIAVSLPDRPGPLQRADYRALTLDFDNPTRKNHGLEGVGYDRAGDRLFVVKEKSPRRLYEIRGFKANLRGDPRLTVIDRSDWIRDKDFATDLSSVEFDERTGHLLLLSDESKLMMELDRDGGLVGYRSLWGILSGLKQNVPKGEGVTLDRNGNLYLVSEPNLFYVFRHDN